MVTEEHGRKQGGWRGKCAWGAELGEKRAEARSNRVLEELGVGLRSPNDLQRPIVFMRFHVAANDSTNIIGCEFDRMRENIRIGSLIHGVEFGPIFWAASVTYCVQYSSVIRHEQRFEHWILSLIHI